jgi:hypothetical protein
MKNKTRAAVKKSPALIDLCVLEKGVSVGELEEQVGRELSLGYVGDVSWSVKNTDEPLRQLVPNATDEYSSEIIFPAQKPYLSES